MKKCYRIITGFLCQYYLSICSEKINNQNYFFMSQLFPNINHRISLLKAREMTARYKTNKKEIVKKEYEDKKIFLNSETFNRDAFDSLLAQESCVGVRIYFSMDDQLSLRTIIVGVNANNQDILPGENELAAVSDETQNMSTTSDDGVIIEDGRICPPNCPPPPTIDNP